MPLKRIALKTVSHLRQETIWGLQKSNSELQIVSFLNYTRQLAFTCVKSDAYGSLSLIVELKKILYFVLPITLEATYLHQCWTVNFWLIIMILSKHYLPYPFPRRRALASNTFWPSCSFVTVFKVAKAYLRGNRFQLFGHGDSSLSSWTQFWDIKKIKLLYEIIVKKDSGGLFSPSSGFTLIMRCGSY